MLVLNHVQASRIRASPLHPVIAAARGGSLCQRVAVRATSAPAPSCQARVGSEKNATGGAQYVKTTDSPNDRATTNVRTIR